MFSVTTAVNDRFKVAYFSGQVMFKQQTHWSMMSKHPFHFHRGLQTLKIMIAPRKFVFGMMRWCQNYGLTTDKTLCCLN